MKKQTVAVHSGFQIPDAYNSLAMPVYHTVAYEFDNAEKMSDAFCGKTDMPDYSRVMNPTVTFFENKVKTLTGATDVIAVNSGMAAISNTLFSIVAAGKNIVTSRHLFGNTYSLIADTMSRFGVAHRFCNLTDIKEVESMTDKDTCCIYCEILTNPQMEVADLRALSEIAKKRNIPLIADTTMIPFTEFSASDLGVDIEIVSSTKYLSGGATSIGGLIIIYNAFGNEKSMRSEILFNLGTYMTPHVAYMHTLGLETLNARYRIMSSNALSLAKRLRSLDGIKSVNYTGLEDNRYHSLCVEQFGETFGAMITIELENRNTCFDFINRLKLIRRATNLFDNKSLAIHPASTIFGLFTENERKSMDVYDTTVRLSIGLEDTDDLFEDIKQALV